MKQYIRGWLAAGVMATAAVLLLSPPALDDPVHGPASIIILLLATALAESIELRLLHRNVLRAFTLLETAVVADLVLLPPAHALLAVVLGVGLSQLVRRRAIRKIAWNTAQFAVATALAIGIYHGLGVPEDPFSAASVLALVGAMTVFGAVNTAAFTGLIVAIEGRSARTVVSEAGWLPVISLFGNASVGVIAVAIFELEPALLPFVAAPALGLHLAYRGTVRSSDLLTQVAAERDRLDQIVHGASDGIMLLDGSGVVEVWSPAMEEFTGVPAAEAIGRAGTELLDVRDSEGAEIDPLEPLSVPDPSAPSHTVEMTVQHRAGSQRIVLARHTLVFDSGGRITADVVLLHDVTRQREVEHLKDDFIARASHELRTPLTPIRGFAEVLLRRGDEIPPELRDLSLQQISGHAEQMARIVDDLLLVSRTGDDVPGPEPDLQPTDMLAACKEVVGLIQPTDSERHIELRCAVTPAPVLASEAWIRQILSGLLSNALKFSPAGTPVDMVVEFGGGVVRVRVVDRGRGIPPDQRERIFERFHRIEDPLTMTTRGLGLGLYLARQLARRMGGDISVESTLGVGSTFTLQLPVTTHGGDPVPADG